MENIIQNREKQFSRKTQLIYRVEMTLLGHGSNWHNIVYAIVQRVVQIIEFLGP